MRKYSNKSICNLNRVQDGDVETNTLLSAHVHSLLSIMYLSFRPKIRKKGFWSIMYSFWNMTFSYTASHYTEISIYYTALHCTKCQDHHHWLLIDTLHWRKYILHCTALQIMIMSSLSSYLITHHHYTALHCTANQDNIINIIIIFDNS